MRGCTLRSVFLAHFASLGNIGSTYLSPLQIDSNVQAHTTRSKIIIIIMTIMILVKLEVTTYALLRSRDLGEMDDYLSKKICTTLTSTSDRPLGSTLPLGRGERLFNTARTEPPRHDTPQFQTQFYTCIHRGT